MERKFVITVLVSCILPFIPDMSSAQRLTGDLDFTVRFDNREYNSTLSPSQTLFSMRARPVAGLTWGKAAGEYLMAGADFTLDFGAARQKRDPKLILYYAYLSKNFQAYTGFFQRDKVAGDYPTAFFSDSVKFYSSVLQGALLRYYGKRGYAELIFDWNSMITKTHREKFMLFSAGRYAFCNFFLGYYASVFHHASTLEETGVVDYILAYPYAGYGLSFGREDRPVSVTVRAGWMQSLQNDRKYVGKYVTPGGFQADVRAEWNRLGIYETVYAGDGLMPYYDSYGAGLYFGDPFYRTDSGIYNRLELYWQPVCNKIVSLKISSVHHYDGRSWGWQQIASLSVKLNRVKLTGLRCR